MFRDAPTMISFSVNDLAKARQFYGEVLGIELDESYPSMPRLKLGDGLEVGIYEMKDTHRPASYTLLNFSVDDLAKAMTEMQAKGITFEQYDTPDTKTDEHGVVDYGMMKVAFFNDPAGNNHAIVQMTSS